MNILLINEFFCRKAANKHKNTWLIYIKWVKIKLCSIYTSLIEKVNIIDNTIDIDNIILRKVLEYGHSHLTRVKYTISSNLAISKTILNLYVLRSKNFITRICRRDILSKLHHDMEYRIWSLSFKNQCNYNL